MRKIILALVCFAASPLAFAGPLIGEWWVLYPSGQWYYQTYDDIGLNKWNAYSWGFSKQYNDWEEYRDSSGNSYLVKWTATGDLEIAIPIPTIY